jgi:hypothetical protein
VKISYWLIPAAPHLTGLAEVIAEFARRFDAPLFTPHVTLFSGACSSGNPQQVLEELAANFTAIGLTATGVNFTDEFTKTLFIEFAAMNELTRISAFLQRHSDSRYELKPHLSLVYARLANEVKRSLVREIKVPAVVRFDGIQAVATGDKTLTREDVERWKLLGAQKLRSA